MSSWSKVGVNMNLLFYHDGCFVLGPVERLFHHNQDDVVVLSSRHTLSAAANVTRVHTREQYVVARYAEYIPPLSDVVQYGR